MERGTMRHAHGWLTAGGLLAGGLLAWWLIAQDASGGGSRAPTANSGASAAEPRMARAGEPLPTRRPIAAEPSVGAATLGQLQLTMRGQTGEPVPGHVYWTTSRRPPAFPRVVQPGATVLHGAQRQTHAGFATLPIPSGQWTWVQARSTGDAGVEGDVYRVVPPFKGTRTEELRVAVDGDTLHVFVVGNDMRTPAAQRDVGCRRIDVPSETERPPRSLQTDESGYVRIDGLEPGSYRVTAPGAGLEDLPPYARVVRFVRGEARQQTCTLVVPERRRRACLVVDADFEPAARLSPVLFLTRKDDGSGRAFPVPTPIRPGMTEFALDLPLGAYEVELLPIGRLRATPDTAAIRIRSDGDARFVVRVVENPSRATVTLSGLTQRDLPVMVYPRENEDLLDDTPEVMFFGPLQWRGLTQEVGCPGFRCRLVAMRSNAFWLSRELDLDLRPGEARTVDMVPASMLKVRWFEPEATRDVVVAISTTQGYLHRTLRMGIEPLDGHRRPALVGSVVVPRGPVSVDCLLGSGETAWTREILADHPFAVVEVAFR